MLTVYSIEQSNVWDEIVRSFHEFDIYWLSEYTRAFQIHGDGEPLLLFYESGSVRGINVVMKRDVAHDRHFAARIPEGVYFDIATPYGYGGWYFEGDQTGADAAAFQKEYS
ncbi:MAG: GNAT family N-acetyltransferase, partial [Clostridia bacterium]|nr:GNAT family N-acetyltransferase [Clostridia bacterium]